MVPLRTDGIIPASVNETPLARLFIPEANRREALAEAICVIKLRSNDKTAGLVDVSPFPAFILGNLYGSKSLCKWAGALKLRKNHQ